MTGESLRNAIQTLLETHPAISISSSGHAAHALRYIAENGAPLALEPERKTVQNLWVRADSVDLGQLSDIDSKLYDRRDFSVSKPNHNLFGEAAFKEADLACFKIKSLWEAVRVIAATAGLGRSP